jgi:hypothetical protein
MMRDIDTINDAMDDARAVLHKLHVAGTAEPATRLTTHARKYLTTKNVGAAQERLRKGYGRLRLVE